MKTNKFFLTITEGLMLLYWLLALLLVSGVIHIPPEYMYSDYENPLIVSWNWSFFPMDIIFALVGLLGRFGSFNDERTDLFSVFSLSLMFCAGLMAISFWALNGDFDPFWWGSNLWLVGLSSWCLIKHFRTRNA